MIPSASLSEDGRYTIPGEIGNNDVLSFLNTAIADGAAILLATGL